jgi:hypothetical protein
VPTKPAMSRTSSTLIEPRPPRLAPLPTKESGVRERASAVVIECDDTTCTVIGAGFGLRCRTLQEAIAAVDRRMYRVVWRESTPGFWVGRTLD